MTPNSYKLEKYRQKLLNADHRKRSIYQHKYQKYLNQTGGVAIIIDLPNTILIDLPNTILHLNTTVFNNSIGSINPTITTLIIKGNNISIINDFTLNQNVTHLILIMPNLIQIGNGFMSWCTNLQFFDTSGSTQLTQIGDGFMRECTGLTKFDTSGLTALTKIGNYFMCSTGLTKFDTSGLTKLTQIGSDFMGNCTDLTEINTSGLTRLTQIGNAFMWGCTGLTEFKTSGLTQLTQIGNYFMRYTGLTKFDTSGLTKLTQIGDYFMAGCTGLTEFNASGLTQLTQIGNYFMFDCKDVKFVKIPSTLPEYIKTMMLQHGTIKQIKRNR